MKHLLTLLAFTTTLFTAQAQILFNEGSNANGSNLVDEDSDYEDWFELYNAGPAASFNGLFLSDDPGDLQKWACPDYSIPQGGFVLAYASGKDRKPNGTHWETAVHENYNWRYYIAQAAPPANWAAFGFNDAGWSQGQGGFGFGDNDDVTNVPTNTPTVYIRHTFTIADTALVFDGVLHMDYDDGFVAYLNGTEIARSNNMTGNPPAHGAYTTFTREALMYGGGNPEAFVLDQVLFKSLLRPGNNTLAIQIHNSDPNSSDLSSRPFLSMRISDAIAGTYMPTPAWFGPAGTGSYWHTNFKIRFEGETIFLSNAAGTILDSLFIGGLHLGHSTGRKLDGDPQLAIFSAPTPGATNNTAAYNELGYEPQPIIVNTPGFYPGTIQINITNPSPTAIVRYSLDGEEPQANSPIYTAPFNLNTTAAVRARCFSTVGKLPSTPATATFFINTSFTVPVVSLNSDSVNFWGNDGIFTNYYEDWEKAGYVEYFDQNGNLQFNQNTCFRMDGGASSRQHAQKSMRIHGAHDTFGEGDFDYPLHTDRPQVDDHDMFYVRNGGNAWTTLPYTDGTLQHLGKNTHAHYNAYSPVAVFVQGRFWGIYEMREKINNNHLKNVYGADQDSVDILSVNFLYGIDILRTLQGSDTGYYAMHDYVTTTPPTDPNYFNTVDHMIDVKNYVDYFSTEIWVGNRDWLYNNIRLCRDRAGDNKWFYTFHDIEYACNFSAGVNGNSFDNIANNMGYTLYSQQFQALVQNTQFKNYFVNRFADLINTEFQYAVTQNVIKADHDKMRPEIPRHYLRWTPNLTVANYDASRDNYLLTFAQGRNTVQRNHIQSRFNLAAQVNVTLDVLPAGAGRVHINTIEPGPNPWTGVYFNGVPITVTAIANPGYTFAYWVPNQFITDQYNPEFTVNVTSNTTFTAVFLGAAQTPLITIAEINYNSETTRDAGDWVEILNHGNFGVDVSGWKLKDADDTHIFNLPNVILAAGERMVLAAEPNLFATQHPGVANFGPLGYGLGSTTDQVRLFDNNNTLISMVEYVDSLWPRGSDGGGRTLELFDVAQPINDPANWFDGCIGGSPGAPYTPCSNSVIFSEVNYNSSPALNSNDWVELHNNTGTALNLSNWKLLDDNDLNVYTLPPGTVLPANGYLVLAQTPVLFNAVHPNVTALGPFNFNLSGNGELIRLYNQNSVLNFSLNYDDVAPWPTEPDGLGYTLELLDAQNNMNDGANWFAGCPGGSPGGPFDPACGAVGIVAHTTERYGLYPNPTDGGGVMLKGIPGELVTLTVNDLAGHTIAILDNVEPGTPLPYLSQLPVGVWQVTVQNPSGQRTAILLTVVR